MGEDRPDERQRHARILGREDDPERLERQPEIELGLPVRLRTMLPQDEWRSGRRPARRRIREAGRSARARKCPDCLYPRLVHSSKTPHLARPGGPGHCYPQWDRRVNLNYSLSGHRPPHFAMVRLRRRGLWGDGPSPLVSQRVRTMQMTSTKQLYTYWNTIRGSRSAPDRRDIDPTASARRWPIPSSSNWMTPTSSPSASPARTCAQAIAASSRAARSRPLARSRQRRHGNLIRASPRTMPWRW